MVRRAAMLATLAVLGACATATPGENAESRVDVEVINDIMFSTPMNVYIMHDRGGRTLLGTAEGSNTTRFNFKAVSGRYHLLATSRVTSSEYTSPPFTPMPPETLVWRMRGNILAPIDRNGAAHVPD